MEENLASLVHLRGVRMHMAGYWPGPCLLFEEGQIFTDVVVLWSCDLGKKVPISAV